VLQTPNYYVGSMMAGLGWARGCKASHVRVLYGGLEAPVVKRLDDKTLSVHTDHGFLEGPLDRVYRSETRPFAVGQGLQLSGVQIVVMAVTDRGTPTDVEFRFVWPLEDRKLRWVAWNGNRYAPFKLPPIGEEASVSGFAPSAR
jgi:hypothetical protein